MLGLLFLSALIVAVCLAPFFWFCYKFGPGIQKVYDDAVDSLAEKITPPCQCTQAAGGLRFLHEYSVYQP